MMCDDASSTSHLPEDCLEHPHDLINLLGNTWWHENHKNKHVKQPSKKCCCIIEKNIASSNFFCCVRENIALPSRPVPALSLGGCALALPPTCYRDLGWPPSRRRTRLFLLLRDVFVGVLRSVRPFLIFDGPGFGGWVHFQRHSFHGSYPFGCARGRRADQAPMPPYADRCTAGSQRCGRFSLRRPFVSFWKRLSVARAFRNSGSTLQ